jgi:hypothetical protein
MINRSGSRAFALAWLAVACSSHPEEGTVVELGTGVEGLPGGRETVSSPEARAISGGTLLVTRDGRTAVAADSERDRVYLVNLSSQLVSEVVLQQGDEPGRVAEDEAGRAFVATRRGGAVIVIDIARATAIGRVAVCPSPRGIAVQSSLNQLHVACQTGEVVSVDLTDLSVMRTLRPARDLRDVLVSGERLFVTTFRSAELLELSSNGAVLSRSAPTNAVVPEGFNPSIAWRSLLMSDPAAEAPRILMTHEFADSREISILPGGYYQATSTCVSGVTRVTLSQLQIPEPSDPDLYPEAASEPSVLAQLSMPLAAGPTDIATSPAGDSVALVATGNSWGFPPRQKLFVMRAGELGVSDACTGMPKDDGVVGEPVAVAFDATGRVLVQSREPATLQIVGGPIIELSDESRADTGVALFHMNAGAGVACVSCHPEGGDDGRVWNFSQIGQRRTQTLSGGLTERAPFHWSGDQEDLRTLMDTVFVSRMGAPARPSAAQVAALGSWLDTVAAPPSPSGIDVAAADRGYALFNDPSVACVACHDGPQLTNKKAYDVGRGGPFMVPSLIGVWARAPYMHDGCAQTLRDRFGPCGGDKHGNTADLTEGEISDLVAYLETL